MYMDFINRMCGFQLQVASLLDECLYLSHLLIYSYFVVLVLGNNLYIQYTHGVIILQIASSAYQFEALHVSNVVDT